MSMAEYDTQESKEPHDAILEIKKGMPAEWPGREDCDREIRTQAYVRMVKMHAESHMSDPRTLRDFVKSEPAPDAAYCRSRLGCDISSLLKWHYYIALFCTERGDWLRRAVPLILEGAGRAGGGVRTATYLLIAHNLNRWYNCGLDGRVLEAALEFVRGHGDEKFAHWFAEIVAALEKRPNVRDEIRDRLIGVARKVETGLSSGYLKAAIHVAHDKAPARAAWAEILERHGDEQDDPLRKLVHYDDAKRHLDDAGSVRRINQKAMTAQKSVSLTSYTHRHKIQPFPVKGDSGFERIAYLVRTLRCSIPRSVELARRTEQELRDQFPLPSYLFTRVAVCDDGIPRQISAGSVESDAVDHVRQLASTIRIMLNVLSVNVGPYEKDGRITTESYMDYIKSFGLHGGAALRLIRAGVEAHCSGDHVAAVHILLPQVEQALRSLLVARGAAVAKGRKRVQLDLLKQLIGQGAGVLDTDLAEFLEVWLVDEGESINLRNRVCHGLYADYENMEGYDPLRDLNHGTSLMLALTVCLLTAMSVDASSSTAR